MVSGIALRRGKGRECGLRLQSAQPCIRRARSGGDGAGPRSWGAEKAAQGTRASSVGVGSGTVVFDAEVFSWLRGFEEEGKVEEGCEGIFELVRTSAPWV